MIELFGLVFSFLIFYENDFNIKKTVLQKYGKNSAKSFANLIGQISRDQTVRYLLTLIDDLLSLDKENIYLFHEYSVTMNQSAWAPFMNLLSRPDHFISHQGKNTFNFI